MTKTLATAAALALTACSASDIVTNTTTGPTGPSGSTSGRVTTTSSSTGTSATTNGGSIATSGSIGATGGTTGTQTTSGTTAATTIGSGTTSGGASTGGSIGGSSSTTGGIICASEFSTCDTSVPCGCGLVCVVDPAFTSQFSGTALTVCEQPCQTASDCPNAATYCTIQPLVYPDGGADAGADAGIDAGFDAGPDAGADAGDDGGADAGFDGGTAPDAGTDAGVDAGPMGPVGSCAVLQCAHGTPGSPCPVPIVDADAGTVATGLGTCVPQSDVKPNGGPTVLLCLPPGDATSCDMTSNQNPLSGGSSFFGTGNSLQVATPQPRDPSDLCARGDGCVDGGCASLCATSAPGCDAGSTIVCVSQDTNDTSWGFCLPCGASGSDGGTASSCVQNGDCCEHSCKQGPSALQCFPGT